MTGPDGEVLHLNREAVIPDNDGERDTGQANPFLCDWDGDGRPDLMCGAEAGTVYLFHRDWVNGLQPTVSAGEIRQDGAAEAPPRGCSRTRS